jgi:hypothetical protein
MTIRGSGFLAGITTPLGGKFAMATLQDRNTRILTTFSRLVFTNPEGESVSLAAAFLSQ